MKTTFKAITIEQSSDKLFSVSVKDKFINDLPDGELLIKVSYSSLNYKDALSSSGNLGVTKKISSYTWYRCSRNYSILKK